MKRGFQKVFGLVTALVLCVAMLPMTALGAQTAVIPVTTVDELVNALQTASTDATAPTEIKLMADLSVTTELTVLGVSNVCLDLNGYVLSYSGSKAGRVINSEGCLTIKDSNPSREHDPAITYTDLIDETITNTVKGGCITGGYGVDGAGVRVGTKGSLTLEGGSICKNASYSQAGGVLIDGGSFVLTGGSVCGNTAGWTGGGITVRAGAEATMTGGIVTGNRSTDGEGDGGGIYVYGENSSFVLKDGKITRNQGAQGGGIGIYDNSLFRMEGGLISENKGVWTRGGGGGVNAYACAGIEMTGGEISGNMEEGRGGGVRMTGVPFTMSGNAVIKNNTAVSGGGIYTSSITNITMSGNAKVCDNVATKEAGGGIDGGNLTMSGNAVITGNKAALGNGGGINIASIVMSENTAIDNNTCGGAGGGIATGGTVSISDKASVSGNTAGNDRWGGGGIFCTNSGAVTMNGGIVNDNESAGPGGGIALYYYGALDISGGTIKDNHAVKAGGGVYNEDYDDGNIRLSGNPVIIDNTSDEAPDALSNVVQLGHSRKYIHVNGKITEGAKVGVTTIDNPSNSAPAAAAKDFNTYNNDDPAAYFVSDVGYLTLLDANGHAAFASPMQKLAYDLAQGGTVKLTEDIKAMSIDKGISLPAETEATLDLNGHVIDGMGTSDNLFYLRGSEIKLTIMDSRPDAAHDPEISYVNPITNEKVAVTGGVMKSSKNQGFMASYGSEVTMKGGTITDCNGAVHQAGSIFRLEGGQISGNHSTGDGGAVFVYEAATLEMTGGRISHNTAAGSGGGVFLYNNQSNTSLLKLTGGEICENQSIGKGGGVTIANRGRVEIGGNPVVTENRSGEKDGEEVNNLYIGGALLAVTSPLKKGADIGISSGYGGIEAGNYISFTDDQYGVNNPDTEPDQFFKSDHVGWAVAFRDGVAGAFCNDYHLQVTPAKEMHAERTGGELYQDKVLGAIKPITYMADEGYYFPSGYPSSTELNGIRVRRVDAEMVTIIGTLTGNCEVTLEAAIEKIAEETPKAVLDAVGNDKVVITGVEPGMKYSIDDSEPQEINGETLELKNLGACTISIWRTARGSGIHKDSEKLTIIVTKADTPKLVPVQPVYIGEKGSLPVTEIYEISTDGQTYLPCTGEINDLQPGIYYVRVAAKGNVLASDPQKIEIETPTQEPEPLVDVTEKFGDVAKGKWFVKAVQFVYDRGIMSGKGTSFQPNTPVTREEFAQTLYNHMQKPDVNTAPENNPFPDVKAKGWYLNAVLWAKDNDIVTGYGNGKFGVGDEITREQFAQMLYKYAKLRGYDTTLTQGASDGFADSDKRFGWAHTALDWAVSQGIMAGKGKNGAPKSEMRLDPKGSATRAECAQMVMKLLQKNGL